MNNKIVLYSCAILFGTFISSISQVFLKKSSQKVYSSKIKEYLNPLVIISYSIFICATLLSILAYKIIPLSLGPVLESTSYIYVTVFGVLIFKETINRKKMFALFLIIGGIVCFSIIG